MKCGNCDLTIPPQSLRDIRTIQSGMYYCRNCKHIGIPIVFEDEEEYRKFLEAKKNLNPTDI